MPFIPIGQGAGIGTAMYLRPLLEPNIRGGRHARRDGFDRRRFQPRTGPPRLSKSRFQCRHPKHLVMPKVVVALVPGRTTGPVLEETLNPRP